MSMDYIFFTAEGLPTDARFPPVDWEFPVMGEADDVREMISEVLPEVDWTDTGLGLYEGDDFVLEFGVEDVGDIESVGMRANGFGDFFFILVELCGRIDWVAFDDFHEAFIQNRYTSFDPDAADFDF